MYPRSPSNNKEMLQFNNLLKLNWSHACMYDFWLLELAAVDIKEILSGTLSWIHNDKVGRWFNALYNVALSLIRQYAVMSVNKKEAQIFRVALDDILRAIPTIYNGFEGLTNEGKAQLVVANIPMDLG